MFFRVDKGRYNKNISIYRTLNTRPPRTCRLQKQVYRSMIAYSSATMNDRSGKTSMTVLGTVRKSWKLLIASEISKKTHLNSKKPKYSMKIKKWSQWWPEEQHLDLLSEGCRRFSRYQENENLTVEVVSVQNSSLLVVTIILFFYINKRNLPKKVPENSSSRVSLFAGYEKHFMISWLLIREKMILSFRRPHPFSIHTPLKDLSQRDKNRKWSKKFQDGRRCFTRYDKISRDKRRFYKVEFHMLPGITRINGL